MAGVNGAPRALGAIAALCAADVPPVVRASAACARIGAVVAVLGAVSWVFGWIFATIVAALGAAGGGPIDSVAMIGWIALIAGMLAHFAGRARFNGRLARVVKEGACLCCGHRLGARADEASEGRVCPECGAPHVPHQSPEVAKEALGPRGAGVSGKFVVSVFVLGTLFVGNLAMALASFGAVPLLPAGAVCTIAAAVLSAGSILDTLVATGQAARA